MKAEVSYMTLKKLVMGVLAAVLATGVAFAQPKSVPPSATPGVAPAGTIKPATGTATPPAKPFAPAPSSMPSGSPVNLNTATAQQLDALPEIGSARTKAIVAERQKGKFKDWGDFETRMAHTSINKGVQAKIKDHVTF
jgi:DNA uptake protein ComE-like DNA-binding protein